MKKAIALTVIMGASLLLAQNKEVNSPDFALSGGNELIKLAEDNVLVFRENGTLKVTGSGYVEILAVGGGGGGGARGTYGSGGGGAGGVVHQKEVFVEAGEYAITIGEGGGVGINGGITSALGINAYGGGAGRMADSSGKGNDGASGGGAAMWNNGVPNDVGGAAIYAEYNNMGNAGGGTSNPFGAGGGGGAGEAGETTWTSTPGRGGNGYECEITGEKIYYAGGGAGFRQKYDVNGGLGGGGSCVTAADGQSSTPGPGADGLGGGGCGGANGGSGVFIVRYKALFETVFAGAEGGVKARRKGRYVHTFANDDVFTMPVDGVVDILLVGGGGGGGANRSDNLLQGGAGGGAGGVVHIKGIALRAGSHAIKVGSGGDIGLNGENTVAFGYVAYGGGAGAKYDGRGSTEVAGKYGYVGQSGGSGGGSTHVAGEDWKDISVDGGLAIHGEEGNLGNAGGITTHQYAASGGGGAGGTGGNSNGTSPGVGGIGYSCDISGVSVYYAGGGAGFRNKQQIDGGLGGGGSCVKAADGQSSTPGAGEDGLGGGGCGGAKGGSGIVIVSYQTPPVPFRVIVK